MRARPFVIFEVGLQDTPQTGLVQNDRTIQALAPNGPDQALHVSTTICRFQPEERQGSVRVRRTETHMQEAGSVRADIAAAFAQARAARGR